MKVDPLVREHQETLLHTVERFFGREKMSKSLRRAFLDTPRHLFAPRFYSSRKRDWVALSDEDLPAHLLELYADHPLCIFKDDHGRSLSTISQPSLVLYMLHLLELESGMSVFELGGGSGWNAALMGKLVGETGLIRSVEIIEPLVEPARESLQSLGLDQVEFLSGDATQFIKDGDSFDRGIFTASAWTLPTLFFQAIRPSGSLLFILKAQSDYDLLCLLQRESDCHFSSRLHFTCSFVPVTGENGYSEGLALEPHQWQTMPLTNELEWQDLKVEPEQIDAFVAFAKLVFDCQTSYLLASANEDFDEEFWGIQNVDSTSQTIFNEDRIQCYGSEETLIQLKRAAKRWNKAKQPTVEDLQLDVFKKASAPTPTNDQWLCPRGDCVLRWSIAYD